MKNTDTFARLSTESNAQLVEILDGRPVRMPDGRMESLVVRISPRNKHVIEVCTDWNAGFRDAVWLQRVSVDRVDVVNIISSSTGNEAELAAALLPLLESI
tara:strand:+ start:10686 stop:10988 length:303 start_codon:yes stop_codon:yes gene_type:complete